MPNNLRVKRIVFKEILDGDRRKLRAESHDSQTGGGARDLRFRPYDKFRPIFEKLFPNIDHNNIATGQFFWYAGDELVIKDAFFHPPTTARPNEGRISNIDKYLPVENIPNETEGTAFLLLIQDNEDRVWPSFTTEEALLGGEWDQRVSDIIIKSHAKKIRANRTTSGYVDFEINEVFCNHD